MCVCVCLCVYLSSVYLSARTDRLVRWDGGRRTFGSLPWQCDTLLCLFIFILSVDDSFRSEVTDRRSGVANVPRLTVAFYGQSHDAPWSMHWCCSYHDAYDSNLCFDIWRVTNADYLLTYLLTDIYHLCYHIQSQDTISTQC